MAPAADVWCFDVEAKFERQGIMSSNTLKCDAFPRKKSTPHFKNTLAGRVDGLCMLLRHVFSAADTPTQRSARHMCDR